MSTSAHLDIGPIKERLAAGVDNWPPDPTIAHDIAALVAEIERLRDGIRGYQEIWG